MTDSPLIKDLLTFLYASPTAWHAVAAILPQLKQKGFHELPEQDAWSIAPGQGYIVTRNGSSLCAFVHPSSPP